MVFLHVLVVHTKISYFFAQGNVSQRFGIHKSIQATLLNPDMCNPDFRLNRTVWKVTFPSYTYKYYTHNPDFA